MDAEDGGRLYAAAMAEPAIPQAFVEHLASRDFEAMAAALAGDAHSRMLLPRGPEEHAGREAVMRRFRAWFAAASEFEVLASSTEAVGPRHRLSWRLRVVRDGRTRELIEQVAYVEVGPDGIASIDLLCSGFQIEPGAEGGVTEVFDAGAMGCADGLAQEFRRRITAISVGTSLEVVVRDPAAIEEVPSLARLLGQRVTSTEARDDGRLAITVERLR